MAKRPKCMEKRILDDAPVIEVSRKCPKCGSDDLAWVEPEEPFEQKVCLQCDFEFYPCPKCGYPLEKLDDKYIWWCSRCAAGFEKNKAGAMKFRVLRNWACAACDPEPGRVDYSTTCMQVSETKPSACAMPDCNASGRDPEWVEVQLVSRLTRVTTVTWEKVR